MTIPLRAHALLSVLVGAPLVWEITRVDLSRPASYAFLLGCALVAAAPWLALRFRWWAGALPAAAGVLGSAGLVLLADWLPARPEVVNLPLVQVAGLIAVLVIVLRDAGPWGAALGATGLTLSAAAAAVAIQQWARVSPQLATPHPPTVAGTAFLLFGGALALGVFLRSGYSAASRWTTGSMSLARIDRR
ncbi:hypothetical protein GCM10017786_33490 [Amycolatopsis deserti]|uniref:Uncharacterized protein n=1 Tax=Amycolatopsis deserti TaxID=185696 RepID=A0ABQ3IY37_9PSEU|nr:hypothetical protein [Amycolatopsis deserti]GHE97929.1 hypothetical protein GCM10017786_33490 [Amycolatopsis deserti]